MTRFNFSGVAGSVLAEVEPRLKYPGTVIRMPPRDRVFTHVKFDLSALLDLAARLRKVPCSCDLTQRSKSGSLNWTIALSFEDGVEWIFRSPRTNNVVSLETAELLLASEAATLKYIQLNSSIPVPEVFDYSPTAQNPIGVPFILMSKAPGFPLNDCTWNTPDSEVRTLTCPSSPCLSMKDKEKIMRQLGTMTSQLSRLRFDKIGSLFEESGGYSVKACLSPALLLHKRDTLGDGIPRGPFSHNSEYYESLVSALLLHVEVLRLYHHAFFAPIPVHKEYDSFDSYYFATDRWNDFVKVGLKTDSGKNRLDYSIASNFLRKIIPSLHHNSFATLDDLRNGFPLCHPDLSTGNIFVDSEYNITCIIDWAFSSSVPMSTLLMVPGLPHPRDDTEEPLASAFKAGFVHQSSLEKGMSLDDQIWEVTRRVWLFTRLVDLDGLQDYQYFTELYENVFKSKEQLNIHSLFKSMKDTEEFLEKGRELTEDDRPGDKIKADEKQYFSSVKMGMERHAISRKLTMVSELSTGFVADKRLWRWIEDMHILPVNTIKMVKPGQD